MSDSHDSGWFRDTPETRRLLEIERAKVEAMEGEWERQATARVEELVATAEEFGLGHITTDTTDLRAVLAENEAMRHVLWGRLDDEPCDIDHNGYCQAHGLSSPPCWQTEARRLVGEWQPAEGGEP